jgi:hypothetical protein
MTTTEEKQEENKIIKHILQTNKYNTFKIKNKQRQTQENNPDRLSTRWAKFTYTGKETRIITKLFKYTNIQIAYTTNNNLRKLLNPKQENRHTDIYNRSGAYQLTCNECQKRYIRQTDCPFGTRFKEHQQDYKHNGGKSLYAKHLIEHNHPFHHTENSMLILHTASK